MDPTLQQFGFRTHGGGPPRAAHTGAAGRSPLTDIFPTYRRILAGFEELTVPNNTAFVAGHSAWFGLAKLNVPAQIEQDAFLDYCAAYLSPTHSTGTGSEVAWGELNGTGAAIVVGIGLPSVLGEWSSAPAYVPGVEDGASGNLFVSTMNPYAAVFFFPPGDHDDTAPLRTFIPEPLGKVAFRIPEGNTLDVAFVARASQIANSTGSAKTLYGHVAVDIRVALTRNPVSFNA